MSPVASLPKRILTDTNFLVSVVNKNLSEDLQLRLDYFIAQVEKQHCMLVVPMPALAEYLVKADIAGIESIQILERKAFVMMANFDRAAAFECATLDRAALNSGDKKDGAEHWQKVKVDRQVIAIGKACGAQLIISEDKGLKIAAIRSGLACLSIAELPLPPGAVQRTLDLPEASRAQPKAPPTLTIVGP